MVNKIAGLGAYVAEKGPETITGGRLKWEDLLCGAVRVKLGGKWGFLGGCKGKSEELCHFKTPEEHLRGHDVKGCGLDGQFMSLDEGD